MFKNPFSTSKPDPLSNPGSPACETEEQLFSPDEATEDPGVHFVNPHYVQGYTRADGTVVDGYWRDGDSNTSEDLFVDEGGGYDQTNPDGDLSNNLG